MLAHASCQLAAPRIETEHLIAVLTILGFVAATAMLVGEFIFVSDAATAALAAGRPGLAARLTALAASAPHPVVKFALLA